jgi:hypothetical protein
MPPLLYNNKIVSSPFYPPGMFSWDLLNDLEIGWDAFVIVK